MKHTDFILKLLEHSRDARIEVQCDDHVVTLATSGIRQVQLETKYVEEQLIRDKLFIPPQQLTTLTIATTMGFKHEVGTTTEWRQRRMSEIRQQFLEEAR